MRREALHKWLHKNDITTSMYYLSISTKGYSKAISSSNTRQVVGIQYVKSSRQKRGLLQLRGLGKHVWKGINADEYVRELREEWKESE
ncbi:hypothetical protein [Kosmotoga sp. DU53]|uniref:hypothetical protein n=1 Tax=Kosmotoga sp. DU53 TaxID=1310160 RepID=UPI0007C5567A|nr:hypothetical protein [Kosmotoga sp. DU53]OAA20469.1 hypothetical protein DU53_07355 [Kosmotoga sp. DU53]